MELPVLTKPQIERIARIFGDTDNGLVVSVGETSLGNPTIQGHLTAFKSQTDAAAAAGFLAVHAAAAGGTLTGTLSATSSLAVFRRALGRF